MPLDNTQIADMQGDLGISADQSVFTDTELQRLYTRAEESYALAVYYAFRQLQADAAKLHDYTAGQTEMNLDQVYKHVKDMVEVWEKESRSSTNQVLMVGLVGVPTIHKDTPDTSTRRRNRYPWKDWAPYR